MHQAVSEAITSYIAVKFGIAISDDIKYVWYLLGIAVKFGINTTSVALKMEISLGFAS